MSKKRVSPISRFKGLGNKTETTDDARKFVEFYVMHTTKKSSLTSTLSRYKSEVSNDFYTHALEIAKSLPDSWGKSRQKQSPNLLSETQMGMVYKSFDDSGQGYRNAAMIAILYCTGMRAGELSRLRFDDINLIDKTISWWQQKNKMPAECIIPSREIFKVSEYMAIRTRFDTDELLLSSSKSKHLIDKSISKRGIQSTISVIGENILGVNNLSPVDFRHMWVKRTIPLDVLRWRNLSGLEAYFNVA